jgi:hypothetical protein
MEKKTGQTRKSSLGKAEKVPGLNDNMTIIDIMRFFYYPEMKKSIHSNVDYSISFN